MHLLPSIYCIPLSISATLCRVSILFLDNYKVSVHNLTCFLCFCHHSHYNIKWHTGVYEEMFNINSKILKQSRIVEIFLFTWSRLKWQTLAIIQEISSSNLETGRYGPKTGVSWIIQESWQHSIPFHCFFLF